MKEWSCHKYILRDNQQTCFTDYVLSQKYYSSIQVARKALDGEATEYCFRVIAPLRRTKQTGRYAEILTRHERERKS